MKYLLFIAFIVFAASSCEEYEDCVLPVVGVYEAHVVGISGPFSMVVSADRYDNVKIDAPWLSDEWYVVEADIDGCNTDAYKLDIDIFNQDFPENRRISGEGFYSDYTIQLDYTITDGNDKFHYTIVGTKK